MDVIFQTMRDLIKTECRAIFAELRAEQKAQAEQKAKEMLFEGISISAIAEELRFSSSAHFSAAFKKYTGLSPLKYKKQAPHS